MSDKTAIPTPLFDLHEQAGARLVDFAGYALPIQYPAGIIAEHLHTRSLAGLFDVSHMGQVSVSGETAQAGLESLLPTDLDLLEIGQSAYTFMTNSTGGLVDDLIVTRRGAQAFGLVVNASRKQIVFPLLQAALEGCSTALLDDSALLALQGPRAAAVLASLDVYVDDLVFMRGRPVALAGADCYISRSGYTGEDGFEISVPAAAAVPLAQRLLAHDDVQWAGLGARDSLRIEAGLCLYGQDIDEQTSPLEAGLLWSISKSRRPGGSKAGGYPGADILAEQIAQGPARKRVGLAVDGRAPLRAGVELFAADTLVGRITSGGYAPSLERPVAMALVDRAHAGTGAQLVARQRGKSVAVDVVSLPFVPANYCR